MSDFDLLCAIGSGTCGEVSKMKHKPTGKVLAVKVSEIPEKVLNNKLGSYNSGILRSLEMKLYLQTYCTCSFS